MWVRLWCSWFRIVCSTKQAFHRMRVLSYHTSPTGFVWRKTSNTQYSKKIVCDRNQEGSRTLQGSQQLRMRETMKCDIQWFSHHSCLQKREGEWLSREKACLEGSEDNEEALSRMMWWGRRKESLSSPSVVRVVTLGKSSHHFTVVGSLRRINSLDSPPQKQNAQ